VVDDLADEAHLLRGGRQCLRHRVGNYRPEGLVGEHLRTAPAPGNFSLSLRGESRLGYSPTRALAHPAAVIWPAAFSTQISSSRRVPSASRLSSVTAPRAVMVSPE